MNKHIEVFTIAGVCWSDLEEAGVIPSPETDALCLQGFLREHRVPLECACQARDKALASDLDFAVQGSEFSEEAVAVFVKNFQSAGESGLPAIVAEVASGLLHHDVRAFSLDNGTYVGIKADVVFPWQKTKRREVALEHFLESELKSVLESLGIPKERIVFGRFSDYREW